MTSALVQLRPSEPGVTSLPSIEERGGNIRFLDRPDDVRIRFATFGDWEEADYRAVILSGYAAFIERYLETTFGLQARGMAVAVFDWRGQGRSSRLVSPSDKGHVGSFDDHLGDLNAVLETLDVSSARPVILLAHSMGAHLAARFQMTDDPRVSAAIWTAPMFDIAVPLVPRRLLTGVGKGLAMAGLEEAWPPGAGGYGRRHTRFEGNHWTSDRLRFDRQVAFVERDPALALGDPTIGWVRAAHDSLQQVWRRGGLESISTPVLVALAERDAVVDNRAARTAISRMRRAGVFVVPEAQHEILEERDPVRQRFWNAVDGFLDAVGPYRKGP